MIKLPKLQKISAILMRLPKRQRVFLYVAVSFVSLFVLDRLIIRPIYLKILSLERAISERITGIKKNMRILALKNEILSESAQYAPYLHGIEFGEQEVASLLKEVESLANKSSVSIIDIKPQGVREFGSAKAYLINLICEAQMEPLIGFMYDIESSNNLLLISKFQINQKSRESSIASATMTIYKVMSH
jgi:hypothetical protein